MRNHAAIVASFRLALGTRRPGRPCHSGNALLKSTESAKRVASRTGAGKKSRTRKKDLVRRLEQEQEIDTLLQRVRESGRTLLTYDDPTTK